MADTTFLPGTKIASTWLQAVNDFVYRGVGLLASLVTFTQSGTGAVSDDMQGRGRTVLYVTDFMSAADKTTFRAGTDTDITTALQAAIDSLGDTSVPSRAGVDILIPGPGILSTTVTIQRKGVRLVGNGWGNRSDTTGFRRSYLRWNGPAGIPMLKFIDCWQSAGVYRLKMMGLSTAKPSAAIELNNTNTGVAQNQLRIEQVYIGGFASETDVGTQFTDGIIFTGTNNNSEHRLDQVYITGCSGYALRQGSIQQVNFLIDHLTVAACTTGIKVTGSIQGSSWNFSQNGTDIEFPATDDVAASVNAFVSVNNYYSELAGRMVNVPTFSAYRLIVNGGQFQITSSLNADGKIVLDEGNTSGALVLRDFRFTQSSAPSGSPQISMRSAVAGAAQRHIILDGITGWSNLTGGTTGLNIATRGPTDRTYVFFRENAQSASASAARVAQCWVSGVGGDWAASRFEVAGVQAVAPTGSVSAPSFAFIGDLNTGFYRDTSAGRITGAAAGANVLSFGAGYLSLPSNSVLAWCSSATSLGTADTILQRDGAPNTLAQKNSNADQINRQYGMNGGYWERGSASELLTLSTSGATTDTTANLLPANAIIEAVTARVTTTITTATDWKLGDATISGRFAAANATMTAGATSIGTVHADQTGTSGPRQTAAAKVRVTTTGTPGAGVIRITVFYRAFVAPTS